MSDDPPVPDPGPVPDPVPDPAGPAAAAPPTAPTVPERAPAQPESGAETFPEPTPEPGGSQPLPEQEAHPGPDAGPGAKGRRGRRTALILAGAAVLGVLAGGGVGYRIQQQRTPTPLPPLTGPVLAQPAGAGRPAPVLPASQDRQAVYDGDLLALLIPAPRGGKHSDREWQTIGDYADRYSEPASAFQDFAANDFRRAVSAWWMAGGRFVTVDLVQFRDDAAAYAPQRVVQESLYPEDSDQYADGVQIDGTTDGMVWGSDRPEHKSGYVPIYHGEGVARVGSIEVDVQVDSPRPVPASAVMSLITKQLERL